MHLFRQSPLRPPQLTLPPFSGRRIDHRGVFSAIMIVGAVALVEVTAGITDDPRPVEAVHVQLAVDDA